MGLPCISEIVLVGIWRWAVRHWLPLAFASAGMIWWLSR